MTVFGDIFYQQYSPEESHKKKASMTGEKTMGGGPVVNEHCMPYEDIDYCAEFIENDTSDEILKRAPSYFLCRTGRLQHLSRIDKDYDFHLVTIFSDFANDHGLRICFNQLGSVD